MFYEEVQVGIIRKRHALGIHGPDKHHSRTHAVGSGWYGVITGASAEIKCLLYLTLRKTTISYGPAPHPRLERGWGARGEG